MEAEEGGSEAAQLVAAQQQPDDVSSQESDVILVSDAEPLEVAPSVDDDVTEPTDVEYVDDAEADVYPAGNCVRSGLSAICNVLNSVGLLMTVHVCTCDVLVSRTCVNSLSVLSTYNCSE